MVEKLDEFWPPTNIWTMPIKTENQALNCKTATIINLLKLNTKDLPRNAVSNMYMWNY